MIKQKTTPAILEIKIWSPERMESLLIGLKRKISEHFEDGGRVKIIHSNDSPPQELQKDFTFKNWKD